MKRDVKKFFREQRTIFRVALFGLCCVLAASSSEAAIVPFSISGSVEIKISETASWIPLQRSMLLRKGAHLRTSLSGELSLSCADGSELHLGPRTQVKIQEAFFEEQAKSGIYRILLIRGKLDASIKALGRSEFILTKDSLSWLLEENVPQSLVNDLVPLTQQRFTEEKAFLDRVKTQIGKERTVRYKLLLLESAANRNRVFALENDLSETTVGGIHEDSRLTMTVNDESLQVDVMIVQGQFLIHRRGQRGKVNVFGLSDGPRSEGLRFALHSSGGRVRLTNVRCDLSVESSVWLADFQALIGESETLIGIENGDDAPDVLIKYDKGSIIRLEKAQEVLLRVPAEQQLDFEFSDIADVNFGFCQQLASFVFVENGCPEINGKKNCHGEVSIEKEEPVAPPPPDAPTPHGGYLPPTKPPIKPGSPILP